MTPRQEAFLDALFAGRMKQVQVILHGMTVGERCNTVRAVIAARNLIARAKSGDPQSAPARK